MWFFGAYQPALSTFTRVVNPTTANNPAAGSFDQQQKQQVQYLTGNLTSQVSQNIRVRGAFNNSYSKRDGLLPALNGTDPVATNYSKASAFPNYSVSGTPRLGGQSEAAVRLPRRLLLLGPARFERHRRATHHLDHDEQCRLAGCAGEPAARDRLHQRSVEHQGDARSADPSLLPGRQHRVREPGRRARVQVRHPGRPGRQQRVER